MGEHRDLLAYLVRRLLENGANSSFVHQLADAGVPADELLASPLRRCRRQASRCRATCTAPARINRTASISLHRPARAAARRAGRGDACRPCAKPMPRALAAAMAAPARRIRGMECTAGAERAAHPRAAPPTAARRACREFCALLVTRRAQDLGRLRRRSARGDRLSAATTRSRHARGSRRVRCPAPPASATSCACTARGVFVCISPWNFPLAIFAGQVVAALVAGNAVAAKPAEQTPGVAQAFVDLLHDAGVPRDALAAAARAGRNRGRRAGRASAVRRRVLHRLDAGGQAHPARARAPMMARSCR